MIDRLSMPQAGAVTLLVAVAWGPGASAQVTGTIQVTARVVEARAVGRSVQAGLDMARRDPSGSGSRQRITVIHW